MLVCLRRPQVPGAALVLTRTRYFVLVSGVQPGGQITVCSAERAADTRHQPDTTQGSHSVTVSPAQDCAGTASVLTCSPSHQRPAPETVSLFSGSASLFQFCSNNPF